MTLKHVLGTMLASRMAGRGGRRGGGLGTAAMFGMLGGRRRGGLGRKAGLAALGYMAYQAYQARQPETAERGGQGRGAGSGEGISGLLNDLADRLGVSPQRSEEPAADGAAPDEREAAERFSDEKALLLIRAMVTAAHADGQLSPVERARIVQHLQARGADVEDRRLVEREMENPRSLDALLAEVRDHETAEQFYLASRAAVDGQSEAHRVYLTTLRQRLGLSEAEAAEIEGLAS